MWTKVSLDNIALLQRFVAIMRHMDGRYHHLDLVRLRSEMAQRANAIYHFQDERGELVMRFVHSPRHSCYYLWSIGFVGLTPDEALPLAAEMLAGAMSDLSVSFVRAIRPVYMDHTPAKEFHDLVAGVNDRSDIDYIHLNVLSEMADSVLWRLDFVAAEAVA